MTDTQQQNNPAEKIDVEALMERIRGEVRSTFVDGHGRFPKPPLSTAKLFDGTKIPLFHCVELNSLHAGWTDWLIKPEFSSHRRGIGGSIVRAKQYAVRFVLEICFKGFFQKLYDFNWNVVQFCTRSAHYIDARDAEIFWQLIHKLDNDIQAINDKCDRLYSEVLATLQMVEARESAAVPPPRDPELRGR